MIMFSGAQVLESHWGYTKRAAALQLGGQKFESGSVERVDPKLGDGSGVKGYFTDDDCNTVTAIVRSIWWAVTTQPSTNKLQLRPLKRKQDRW